LSSGVYGGAHELARLWRAERTFTPTLARAQAQALMARWEHTVAQAVL
jgi:glycerol kinase